MKVLEVTSYGGSEVLRFAERDEPKQAPGRVRVRVRATLINPVDSAVRAGYMTDMTPNLEFPFLLGWDFAGELIDSWGALPEGAAVAGLIPWLSLGNGEGSWAEVISADPSWLTPIPDGVSMPDAASLALNALTGAQALALLGVVAGQKVLVTGASGAVGGFATQLVTNLGATVIAVASAGDEDYVTGLGAKHVLGRAAAAELAASVLAIAPDGVDAILDAAVLGADLMAALRDGGAFCTVQFPAIPKSERGIATMAIGVEPNSEQLGALLDQLAAGTLTTRIADVVPFAQALLVQQRVEAGGVRGKIVLAR